MLPHRSASLILVVFFVSWTHCANLVQNKGIYPSLHNLNISRAGICTLEVPVDLGQECKYLLQCQLKLRMTSVSRTIDLISPEDRTAGLRPQGNGSRPGFSKIEICCSGWARKPHTHFECEPICDNGCPNGNCTAPNVCSCRRGYVKDRLQNCVPTCPIGCLNGVCTNTGYCSCNAGFRLADDGKLCEPVCTGGCGIGGECVGAESCRCKAGFSLNRQTNKCEYHCEGGCGAGTCIGPNQCSCKPGFKEIQGACVAECPRGCRNGRCTGPGVCSCDPGWNLDKTGTICEASCRDPCLNADCTAPNTCTCKKGYVMDPLNSQSNRCVAHCPGGCENGSCTSPNFCICNPGFVKEAKGSSRCVRRLKRSPLMHYELIPVQDEQ